MLTDTQLADRRVLEQEAVAAARDFDVAEKEHSHALIGCANGDHAKAMFFCLRAAEMCCGAGVDPRPSNAALLKLALKEVEKM